MKQQILFQTHYTIWATERILAACATLSRDEVERDLGGSHPTIARNLYHFFVSEEFWVQCLCADSIARLADIGGPEWLPGDPEPSVDEMPRWRLLTHVVNHSTLHRGQVTDKLRRLGRRPPNTDVFTYAVRNPWARQRKSGHFAVQ